jgi:nucleoside phosphorylase
MSVRPVTRLISAGVAGGCDPALRVGDVVRAGVVVDTRTGERFADLEYKQVLATVATVADAAEKRRLFAAYGTSAVDMEAAAVARLAQAHGLGFAAVKTISDAVSYACFCGACCAAAVAMGEDEPVSAQRWRGDSGTYKGTGVADKLVSATRLKAT